MSKRIRIGIDVGGTFTKAVALDFSNGVVVGKVTVPTTHGSQEGVSKGIIIALNRLMNECNLQHSQIELIAHSTTQAVNALLEGDTAKVGIIGMGVGLDKSSVVKRTNIHDIKLASHKYLKSQYRFLDTSKYLDEKNVLSAINQLKEEGAEVLVVSEAYGVDDPSNELFVMKKSDMPSTSGHELTGIYGLEIRTITAAINASILPKAIVTARFVETAVRNEKISAPVMLMKGDGGVTDMQTFQNKPILTVLSGPAASVAGALLHLSVLDGIFIEVGGTSTNICVIKGGKPEVNYVTIIEHPTCIRSLDVRVAGVAGGSLIRWSGRKITDVGPRSAHIANLPYSCFANPEDLENGQIITFKPKDGDPMDYVAIETGGGNRYAITNTCAANALELIPAGDYAVGNQKAASLALSILASRMGMKMTDVAESILEISARKIIKIIEIMVRDYKLKSESISLVGGGGGASVLVPFIARKLGLRYNIAENAEVISSIGVAAAMIREERERTINNPNPKDIALLTDEVKQMALNRGVSPESLVVESQFISEKSVLRAIATGNVNLDIGSLDSEVIDEEHARILACELFGINQGVQKLYDMKNYHVFACEINKKKLFLKSTRRPVLVLDNRGRVKLSIDNASIINGGPGEVADKIDLLLKHKQESNNKTGLAPQVHLLDGTKIVDFSSLTSREHVTKAIRNELEKSSSAQVVAIIKI
ncbi:MAG TPA: hydantoinase/oxoprolinase family protein [Nitrososphaeraceae archaeon]|jgi:N-methylhydantoinase A/oxoprolinase/acetone carboxylase beta subunit